jgi:hypothetical protein
LTVSKLVLIEIKSGFLAGSYILVNIAAYTSKADRGLAKQMTGNGRVCELYQIRNQTQDKNNKNRDERMDSGRVTLGVSLQYKEKDLVTLYMLPDFNPLTYEVWVSTSQINY